MQIPPQPQSHPDQWIQESIDYLLEPEMDHPSTSKFFLQLPKKNSRTTKPTQKITITSYLPTFNQKTTSTASSTGKRPQPHHPPVDILDITNPFSKNLTSLPFSVKCFGCQ